LVPVKQVIRYFYIENAMAEELLHSAEKSNINTSLFGKEIDLFKLDILYFAFLPAANQILRRQEIILPSTNAADIETPPPNCVT
jgi:hypothetical protein